MSKVDPRHAGRRKHGNTYAQVVDARRDSEKPVPGFRRVPAPKPAVEEKLRPATPRERKDWEKPR